MSTELAKRPDAAVQRIEDLPENAALSTILRVALTDDRITPEKIGQLLAIQERAEDRLAARQFNEAMQRLKPLLPRIAKNGKIKMVKDGVDKGTIPFAKYEDLDAVIRPILEREGFTTSFVGEDAAGDAIALRLIVRHVGGHVDRSSVMKAPPDKGAGRNDLQARGSTMSYLKRYLTLDYFDIVTEGADDDGAKHGQITQAQRESLQRYLDACGVKEDMLLKTYGLKALGDLPKTMLEPAFGMVTAKYRANLKAQGCDAQDIDEKVQKAWTKR